MTQEVTEAVGQCMWEYGSRSVNSSRARDFLNVSVLLKLSHLGSWCYYLSVLVVGRLVNRGPESGRSSCQWTTFYSDRLSIPTSPDPSGRFDPGQQRNKVFTPGQFWPSGIVIGCVCGSVCSCVCVFQSRACPHDNSSLIQARIIKFGPEMQNTLV